MCLLCGDEKAYRAYMDYLDAVERQGRTADPDEAMKTVFDRLQVADTVSADDPRNDRTLSPFFCSAVDK
jgi:hypothetical protein